MKAYLPLLVLPGGLVLFAIVWLWRRSAEPLDATINTLIVPPLQKFSGADEALQAKSAARREIAESIRKRSALVASGSRAGDVLKIVRKA